MSGCESNKEIEILYIKYLIFNMKDFDYNIISPEKIAFIAYNIGVYETVQKFGESIIQGKITSDMDISGLMGRCQYRNDKSSSTNSMTLMVKSLFSY